MHERDRWKRASCKRKRTVPSPATSLRGPFRELAAAVLRILEALGAGRWPDDGGALLSRRRYLLATAVRTSGLGAPLEHTRAVLEELGTLLEVLHLRTGSPPDHVAAFREMARALDEECEAEIAAFTGGT